MRRKVKRNKQIKKAQSMIGKIIDLPLADFEKELIDQKVNIGTMNNIILNLSGAYHELVSRKEAILKLVFTGAKQKDDPEVQKSLNGLYAEMTKVEQKITYLKQRVAGLVDVDKTPN